MLQMIEVQYLFFNAHSPLQRVYLRDGFGGMWTFVNVSWPWFSLQLRTTGDVLDGAGNESNSTRGEVICAHKVDEYCSYNYMISSMSAAYMLPYNVGELAQFREFQQWRLVFTEG